jgi:hypothetical protein
MDETTPLDTDLLSDLLHAVADSRAPVCGVSIDRARRAGGRQRAVRRLHLPWAAPIAAAAAVAVIAAVAVPLSGHAQPRPPVRAASRPVLMRVPGEFSALSPIVTLGWLPSGFEAGGVAQLMGGGPTSQELRLQARGPGGQTLVLRVFAAGACRLGGPVRRPAPFVAPVSSVRWVRYPLSGNCLTQAVPAAGNQKKANLGGLPLVRRVAPVNGGPAYSEPGGGIYWEYGRNAWASLMSIRLGRPLVRESPASGQLVRHIASRLQVSTAAVHPLYGFTLTGMPASWGTGYPISMLMLDGRLAVAGFSFTGPAADPGQLSIGVWPAPAQYPCNFIAGQSSYITVDGVRSVLRNMISVGKHTENLCIPDVDGLSVGIGMDTWSEGTDPRPLPGWPSHGVLAMFRHMHLLGPDVANWTTNPLR